MIEGHGDDLFRYCNRVRFNFSSNIPQCVSHAGLMRHLSEIGEIFRNYPEPAPTSVEKLLACKLSVNENNVIVGNGVTEIIYLIAHLFKNHSSSIFMPTFREYQDACKIFSHQIKFVKTLDSIPEYSEVVWLCNPNNPTGQTFDYHDLISLINNKKNTLFVIDQAYGTYSVNRVLSVSDVLRNNNIVILESFTKRFTVPGLRIGYAIGPKAIVEKLKSLRMPWSVNSIAIEAAKYLLNHTGEYAVDFHFLHEEALRMIRELKEAGFKTTETDCNFFLCETPVGTSAELKEWLVTKYDILIREASNFEGLSDKYFRIAVQGKEENNLLIKALTEWIQLY